jgi:D-hydroxyproline dehydrogenase subunit gamma
MPADRGASVDFYFGGRLVMGRPGQSVAIALWDAGIRTLRHSPIDGAPRGLFCVIGVCQECVVMIGEGRRPACTTLVQSGLRVLPVSDLSTGPGH